MSAARQGVKIAGLSKEELVGTIVLVLTDGVYATTNILHIPEGSREIIGLANVGLRLGTYSAGILMICTADLPLVSGFYEWDGTVWRDAPHAVMNLIARSGTSQPMAVKPTDVDNVILDGNYYKWNACASLWISFDGGYLIGEQTMREHAKQGKVRPFRLVSPEL